MVNSQKLYDKLNDIFQYKIWIAVTKSMAIMCKNIADFGKTVIVKTGEFDMGYGLQ